MPSYGEKMVQKLLERIQQSQYGRKIVAFALIAGVLAVTGHFVYKLLPRSYTLTITGGEIVGNRHFMAKVLQEEATAAGITLKIIPTHGSVQALEMLQSGQLDLALVQGGLENNWTNVEHVATLPAEIIHFLVRPDIKTIADLKGKQVNLGSKGGGTRIVARQILSFSNLEEGIDYVEVNHGNEELLGMRTDRLPDAVVTVSFLPSFIADYLIKERGYRLLELPFPSALSLRQGWVSDAKVLAYMYSTQPPVPATDIKSVGLNLSLLMNRTVDSEAVFKLLEVLYAPRVASRTHLRFDEKDITRPSGFPVSNATTAFLDRANPLLSAKMFDTLKNSFGLGVTLLSALMVIVRWFNGQTASDDKVFKALLKEVAKMEGAIRAIDASPAATVADIVDIDARLSKLKEKILSDFPASMLNDASILDKLVHSIADTRAYQRAVQTRIEARTRQVQVAEAL
jgi:TRAP-type uncharacterized transport system substrate-binding protein